MTVNISDAKIRLRGKVCPQKKGVSDVSIGITELIIIIIVAMLVIKPQKAMDIAKNLGKGLREFKEATKEVREVKDDIKTEVEEVRKDIVS